MASGDHSPREYQLEMLRQAKTGSVIVKLNTGSGKTFIAVLLIQHLLPETEGSILNGAKRIVFIVKTVHLVAQQAVAIRRHTSLDTDDVGEYHGRINSSIDFWEAEKWEEEFNAHRVLVFTAGIFKDILNHAKFSLRRICLIIFDECHHSAKDDDYAHICQRLREIPEPSDRPKVLGLTASVVNGNLKSSQIEDAVLRLEMMLNARLVTSSSAAALSHGAETQEILCFYPMESELRWSNFTNQLQTQLGVLQEMVRNYRQKRSTVRSLQDLGSSSFCVEEESAVEKAKRAVSDCLKALPELGAWGALCVTKAVTRDLQECFCRAGLSITSQNALNGAISAIEDFQKRLQEAGVIDPDPRWISGKVSRLLDILATYFESKDCRAIVFVEQRSVCFALSSLLEHPIIHINGVRPAFVTGHGLAGVQAREVRMATNTQLSTVSDFRSGKVNLLVATKVVEEGMDIQACNLVIKFDFPSDYRSYVQSKGRARAKNSAYIVFIERTLDNGLKDRFRLQEYNRISEDLNKVISDRAVDLGWNDPGDILDIESHEDELINNCSSTFQPYGQNGPRITLNSAMGIINRYVGRLRHDCINSPKAHIFVLDDCKNGTLKKACVLLPMPCPLREPIIGPYSRKELRARKWAALTACQRLFEAGELGEDLLPHPKKKFMEEEEEEPMDEDVKILGKTGSRRRRRNYDTKMVPELGEWQIRQAYRLSLPMESSSPESQSLSLYFLEVEPSASAACQIHDCLPDADNSADLRLGFLFPAPLHRDGESVTTSCLAQFPLFFPSGPSCASLIAGGKIALTNSEMRLVAKFHELVVSCLIGTNSTFTLDRDSPSPLDSLHFNLNKSTSPFLCSIVQRSDLKLALSRMETAVNFSGCRTFAALPTNMWRGSIFRARHYKDSQQHHRERWVVRSVAEHLLPSSAFPDPNKACTFAEYFNQHISTPNQPMMEVTRLPTVPETVLFRHPEAMSRTQRRVTTTVYHIPELCDRYPLWVDLWMLVSPMPAVLIRLQQLFGARQLHKEIWPHIPVGTGPSVLRCDQEVLKDGFDFSPLIEALTAIECRDFFNLERLEVMGDSFLKYAISTVLFALNEGPRIQEGQLTSRRRHYICNAALYRRAISRDITNFFRTRFFDPASEFQPPAFAPSGTAPTAWTRMISDKAIADCVEALIGYAIVHLGEKEALRILCWLNLDPGFQVVGNDVTFPPVPAPFLSEMSEVNQVRAIQRLSFDLDKVETIIGHKFRQRVYLIQALTHASCVENRLTECYQKLEYLGDAVIDYLITKRIFRDGCVRGPGELSDLRSALVNNTTFAAVVTRSGLHSFLRHSEPRLFKLIPEFEAVQAKRDHNMRSIEFLDDGDGNVILKILGDVFESLAGAIFVDTDFSLEVVDAFVLKLMNDVIEDFSKVIPKNPVRMLHESFPGIKFSEAERDDGNALTRLSVTIKGETFSVAHRNKKSCKRILAHRILERF